MRMSNFTQPTKHRRATNADRLNGVRVSSICHTALLRGHRLRMGAMLRAALRSCSDLGYTRLPWRARRMVCLFKPVSLIPENDVFRGYCPVGLDKNESCTDRPSIILVND